LVVEDVTALAVYNSEVELEKSRKSLVEGTELVDLDLDEI
jgi:hypothetical protein